MANTYLRVTLRSIQEVLPTALPGCLGLLLHLHHNTPLRLHLLFRLFRLRVNTSQLLLDVLDPLVNVGAKLLEEGHALRASDIDTVYVNGYGFPAYVGGPMWYADTQGLGNVLADIERFYAETKDEAWKPAELLKKLAADGSTFASLDG